ncbi:MAG: DOPA 4,5-dioxygenase family protein [Acidobacteria bacterium]|nr:DOPA 4,5-dioxygenase family protein [Acidobacteriota bacterium]
MSDEQRMVQNTEQDQEWADLLSPTRRSFLVSAGLTAAGLTASGIEAEAQDIAVPQGFSFKPIVPPPDVGKSPWGYETYKEAVARPKSIRPGEESGLPKAPRAYTDIKSYHAHFYFDEDTYEKAALVRKWVIERFPVELGNWNLQPRGPHVTPSFYFGFTNDLLPIVVPWLQLNSLGLTILLHPNTDDPRADHLYYTLWVNRSQAVNAYGMPKSATVEKIFPNIKPTVKLEV